MRRLPWIALAGLAAGALGAALAPALAAGRVILPPCPFKAFTGWPCATCGLTRWAQALALGDWRGAFHWHPVASVLLLLAPLAIGWDLGRAWRRRPYPALPDSALARGAVATLLLLTWLIQAVRGI